PPTPLHSPSLHDALPILVIRGHPRQHGDDEVVPLVAGPHVRDRVEDHPRTSWMWTVVTTASRGREAARIATTSVTDPRAPPPPADRKSTRLNSSHVKISY